MVIITRGGPGRPGADGAFTQDEQLALELELAFKSSSPTIQKYFGYDSTTGNLSIITIYAYDTTSASPTIVLFTKVLDYDNDSNLIQVIITRLSDGATLTKDFTYDVDGNITIITSVHSPP
jgi:hypothetical protein